MAAEQYPQKSSRFSFSASLIKRIGVIGFLFFLIKGLLWLTVPGILIYFGIN